METKKLKETIKSNCTLKSVKAKVTIHNGMKKNIVDRRIWEITDIKLEPIIEEAEKLLRPRIEKEIKKQMEVK